MLEKPDIEDEMIASGLQDEYHLPVSQVIFLPLGFDVNTAVYRVVTEGGTAYFLKLRKGAFDERTVAIPQYLRAQGIRPIPAPLETRKGRLWGSLENYKTILYPFLEGRDGYEIALTDPQWVQLGADLKKIHNAQLPAALKRLNPVESYSPRWRERVRAFQAQVEKTTFEDPTAAKFAAFMKSKRDEISQIVSRAERLSIRLQTRSLQFVLCHSDLHPGNFLITTDLEGGGNALYIVDWDDTIFAPKERDLMFIGAGMGGGDLPGGREEALFFLGYSGGAGQTIVDPEALAYYRYERIIADIAAFCEQVLLTVEGGEDRERAYHYFAGQFLPNNSVDIAHKTDPFFLTS